MEVFEITGNVTGISRAGVNFLQPGDSYQNLRNGQVYRQDVTSRRGISPFATRLSGETRVLGIFEFLLADGVSKQLLVADTNFLYKYNTGTSTFDAIPFGGSMAAYAGFAITAKEDYISGTSYPSADNSSRFVFTGKGITPNANGSSIFFYDGTSVLDYTDTTDNPNYAHPPQGDMTSATSLLYFGERLNFIVPVIDGITYAQGMQYSGIRDGSGNGDKYNAPGSGLLQLDTSEPINGAMILGQVIAVWCERSPWTIEKTRDAFNPYYSKKVPGALGSDAYFSLAQWGDTVKALGKTGAVTQDGRRSDRFDNRIPYFTADDIDQIEFQMIYGGFDRINGQFLWSYLSSPSESQTQDAVLVYNYEEGNWAIFDLRLSCFGQTDVGSSLAWDDIDETAGNASWASWDTTEEVWDKIGIGSAVQKTLAGDDLGFIYNINSDYDDYFASISGITQANSAVLTVSDSAFKPGDLVTISQVQGMTDINNFQEGERNLEYIPYTVTASTDVSVTINFNSSQSPAYVSGGVISKVIDFYAETIPFNPYRDKGLRVYVSHVDFYLENNGGYLKVDVFSDEESSPFIQNVVCAPPEGSVKACEWVNMTVNQESNFITFALKQQTPGSQLVLKSMKIYCQPGGSLDA